MRFYLFLLTLSAGILFVSAAARAALLTDSVYTGEQQHTAVFFGTTDHGATWQDFSTGLPEKPKIANFYAGDGAFFFSTHDGYVYHSLSPQTGPWVMESIGSISPFTEISGIFRGRTGTYVSIVEIGLFRKSAVTGDWYFLGALPTGVVVRSLEETGTGELFISGARGIYKSADDGKSWALAFDEGFVPAMTIDNDVLIVNGPSGIYRSDDKGATWACTLKDERGRFQFSTVNGKVVALRTTVTTRINGCTKPQCLYISTNAGSNWSRHELPGNHITQLVQSGEYLFLSSDGGISRSSDGGQSWELVHAIPTGEEFARYELVVAGDSVFAIVRSAGC